MTTEARGDRLIALDAIRGVAVMGILLANLPLFAMPNAGWFSPLGWGGTSPADQIVWFLNFVLVEGKMRGLFSLLFGASMLLVIDRARAAGESGAGVHFRRMTVLFAIGLGHLYLFWVGDILAHYALVACAAYLFVRLSVRGLVIAGVAMLAVQCLLNLMGGLALLDSAARDTPGRIATWEAFAYQFGEPARAVLIDQVQAIRGSFGEAARWRWTHESGPIGLLWIFGLETLSTMLLGMAGLRSGFLTGAWDAARYRRWAIVCLSTATPVYIACGIATWLHGFDQRWVYFSSIVIAEPFRTVMTIGYAALAMLMFGTGAATARMAAVGRAAFTNYLGTTLLMTFVFSGWGLGQFGSWSRWQLFLLPPLVWGLMLLWSKPWLNRFAYGPFEWIWRSLSRGSIGTLRRAAG